MRPCAAALRTCSANRKAGTGTGESRRGCVPRRTTSPTGASVAPAPNVKWLRGHHAGSRSVTARSCLSSPVGCQDGMVVAHTAGTPLNAGPANTMPEPGRRHVALRRASRSPTATADAITGGRDGRTGWTPVRPGPVHGSEGTRSATTPAAEGLFGHVKDRIHASPGIGRTVHARRPSASPASTSTGHDHTRIKQLLGWKSPVEHGTNQGLAVSENNSKKTSAAPSCWESCYHLA